MRSGGLMLKLAKKLRATTLFGLIPSEQLVAILENSPQREAANGDIIIKAEEQLQDHLVLLEGQLEIQRIWSTTDSYDKSHTWILEPNENNNHPGILSAACKRLRVRALSDVHYLFINADIVDELLGWKQQFGEAMKENPQLEQQMSLVRQVSIFHFLPLENIQQAFERMTLLEINAGDTVIEEGNPGDAYYLIKQGEAEVICRPYDSGRWFWRRSPATERVSQRDYSHVNTGAIMGSQPSRLRYADSTRHALRNLCRGSQTAYR